MIYTLTLILLAGSPESAILNLVKLSAFISEYFAPYSIHYNTTKIPIKRQDDPLISVGQENGPKYELFIALNCKDTMPDNATSFKGSGDHGNKGQNDQTTVNKGNEDKDQEHNEIEDPGVPKPLNLSDKVYRYFYLHCPRIYLGFIFIFQIAPATLLC